MDVLWFRLPRLPHEKGMPTGVGGGIGSGRIFIVLDRADHWQAGLVFPKGQYQEVRKQGIEAVKRSIAEIEPAFAEHAKALTDWQQMSLLSVESSRCARWHKPGLLLIGDAAHVMSPVAGVGINFAIQDAVVATNILAQPLRAGRVTESHLAEVQRQREWPTKVIQTMQAVFQKVLIERVFNAQGKAKVPLPLRLLVKIPYLRDVPGGMFAFGARRVCLREPRVEAPPQPANGASDRVQALKANRG
jgi:2-polyprenyl-6-methoxyphenol hydroxylase-like FAD-dependent oxidoreductase